METPFQALEVINAVQTKQVPVEKPPVSMSSWKNAKATIEVGGPEGWGKVINMVEKKDRFGLGYSAYSEGVRGQKTDSEQISDLQKIFSKVGLRDDEAIAAIGEDEEEHKTWIHKSPGTSLNNWTATRISPVISLSK